jgi:hypothetical protein
MPVAAAKKTAAINSAREKTMPSKEPVQKERVARRRKACKHEHRENKRYAQSPKHANGNNAKRRPFFWA